ncbi:flagellar export protein FliJ [Thauera sp. CAU 1555]|uniref:Flagellar FliJ protein n=1 Tax=Thauera sedimentorum TaxID=2767595 RepID=A0ABR9B736_9RHOO|nr:flagellar export protein FliJ [Thauera sedimentorum]MBC9070805.1 flagellar export protein FliJ [Thauera sedimentorum]MBD8501724.1 flagellar export protein FliJ [Thauera sedimentorum]
MNRPSPLQPLLELMQSRMDDAARRLGELIASETEGKRKLDMLQEYRDEYQQRFLQAAASGIGPDAWRNYSAFLVKIDEAIAAQRSMVEQSRLRTVQGQQVWMNHRNKVKAIDTLTQRQRAAELRTEARREQRLSDEHAARRFNGKIDD